MNKLTLPTIGRLAVFALALSGLTQSAQAPSPRMATVTPDTGNAATEFTCTGENLGKDQVAELYLTDGKNDVKAQIVEQAREQIKFKPGAAKPGRYSLMILTADKTRFIEQPVRLTIE